MKGVMAVCATAYFLAIAVFFLMEGTPHMKGLILFALLFGAMGQFYGQGDAPLDRAVANAISMFGIIVTAGVIIGYNYLAW